MTRCAIILHGPPGTGKSTIGKEIVRRCGNRAALCSLDDGWYPGEARHMGGIDRYGDLKTSSAPVLVIELGCGEPPDLSFAGATKGALEWVTILRAAGRTLHPFRLTATRADIVKRIRQRTRVDLGHLRQIWYDVGGWTLYEQRDEMVTLPNIPNFAEQEIATSGRTFVDVATQILHLSGVK